MFSVIAARRRSVYLSSMCRKRRLGTPPHPEGRLDRAGKGALPTAHPDLEWWWGGGGRGWVWVSMVVVGGGEGGHEARPAGAKE